MAKPKTRSNRRKTRTPLLSAFSKSQISHVRSGDKWTGKAYDLLNSPNSKEYKTAWKKSVYHDKIVEYQAREGEIASDVVKKRIWNSIEE